jgi:hypothetical protein
MCQTTARRLSLPDAPLSEIPWCGDHAESLGPGSRVPSTTPHRRVCRPLARRCLDSFPGRSENGRKPRVEWLGAFWIREPIGTSVNPGYELQAAPLPLVRAVLGEPLRLERVDRSLQATAMTTRDRHGAILGKDGRAEW